jgi:hypothetical protein
MSSSQGKRKRTESDGSDVEESLQEKKRMSIAPSTEITQEETTSDDTDEETGDTIFDRKGNCVFRFPRTYMADRTQCVRYLLGMSNPEKRKAITDEDIERALRKEAFDFDFLRENGVKPIKNLFEELFKHFKTVPTAKITNDKLYTQFNKVFNKMCCKYK